MVSAEWEKNVPIYWTCLKKTIEAFCSPLFIRIFSMAFIPIHCWSSFSFWCGFHSDENVDKAPNEKKSLLRWSQKWVLRVIFLRFSKFFWKISKKNQGKGINQNLNPSKLQWLKGGMPHNWLVLTKFALNWLFRAIYTYLQYEFEDSTNGIVQKCRICVELISVHCLDVPNWKTLYTQNVPNSQTKNLLKATQQQQ